MIPPRDLRAGFTLLEVMAVILLTSIVMGLSLDFYVDMSRQTTRAASFTRDIRRATTILDRVARDFEHAVLLRKQPEEDPLAHPWVFVAESRNSTLGADRIKFATLGQVASSTRAHESDLAVVSYLTREGFESGLELLRWSSPQLPESLDRDFPLPEDEGVQLLADGLADFGVRFLGEDGQWTDRWDSSTLLDSSELPLAVEIEIALLDEDQADPFGQQPSARYSRMVMLPMRPLDPEDLSGVPSEEAGAGEETEAGVEDQPSEEQGIEADRQRMLELMRERGVNP